MLPKLGALEMCYNDAMSILDELLTRLLEMLRKTGLSAGRLVCLQGTRTLVGQKATIPTPRRRV